MRETIRVIGGGSTGPAASMRVSLALSEVKGGALAAIRAAGASSSGRFEETLTSFRDRARIALASTVARRFDRLIEAGDTVASGIS